MEVLFNLLPAIRQQQSLSQQEFLLVAQRFVESLSLITVENVKVILADLEEDRLPFQDIYDVFIFATSMYNVNRDNVKLSRGLANITLLLRQLIEKRSIQLIETSEEERTLKPLLYNFPQFSLAHPSYGEFQQETLINFLQSRPTPLTSRLLDVKFQKLRLQQIISSEDLQQWNKLNEAVNNNNN